MTRGFAFAGGDLSDFEIWIGGAPGSNGVNGPENWPPGFPWPPGAFPPGAGTGFDFGFGDGWLNGYPGSLGGLGYNASGFFKVEPESVTGKVGDTIAIAYHAASIFSSVTVDDVAQTFLAGDYILNLTTVGTFTVTFKAIRSEETKTIEVEVTVGPDEEDAEVKCVIVEPDPFSEVMNPSGFSSTIVVTGEATTGTVQLSKGTDGNGTLGGTTSGNITASNKVTIEGITYTLGGSDTTDTFTMIAEFTKTSTGDKQRGFVALGARKDLKFTVSLPAETDRDTNFDFTVAIRNQADVIQATVDPGDLVAGDIDFSSTGGESLVINSIGSWTAGVCTVNCKVTGGTGDNTLTFTAQKNGAPISAGSDTMLVQGSIPAGCDCDAAFGVSWSSTDWEIVGYSDGLFPISACTTSSEPGGFPWSGKFYSNGNPTPPSCGWYSSGNFEGGSTLTILNPAAGSGKTRIGQNFGFTQLVLDCGQFWYYDAIYWVVTVYVDSKYIWTGRKGTGATPAGVYTYAISDNGQTNTCNGGVPSTITIAQTTVPAT